MAPENSHIIKIYTIWLVQVLTHHGSSEIKNTASCGMIKRFPKMAFARPCGDIDIVE